MRNAECELPAALTRVTGYGQPVTFPSMSAIGDELDPL
jgi:hypothetical protein